MNLYNQCALAICFLGLACSTSYCQCGYQLVWEDDFSGSSLDLDHWQYQLGAGGWGNNELQTYTDSNATISGGILEITADEPSPNTYESSRIRTLNLFDIKFGKIEASIKLPEGQGIWPAFWMLPTCQAYGTWPSSGEIDIMEYLGHETNKVHATCHYGNSPSDKDQTGTSYTLPSGDFTQAFHVFEIEWSEDNIKWYVDDILILEVDDTDVSPYTYPFNEEFHLLLNIAIGGNWPGDPDETTTFPQVMEVDYVKVYQLVEDWEIDGPSTLLANSTLGSYAVPDIAGTYYDWIVPSCVTVLDGQGTDEITLDWGAESGEIAVVISLDCQTIYRDLDIALTNDLLTNGDFQKSKNGWYSNFYNGGSGSFDIESTDTYDGSLYGCMTVNSLGDNFWDVQLGNQEMSVEMGQVLTLEFYGRSDQPALEMRVDFRDGSDNSSTDHHTFTLSDSWTYYTYTYTVPYSMPSFYIDFNHGIETGVFCYDEMSLTKDSPLITECSEVLCVDSLYFQSTLIDDGSYHASELLESLSEITSGQSVQFTSSECIILSQGFSTSADTDFSTDIEDCNNQ